MLFGASHLGFDSSTARLQVGYQSRPDSAAVAMPPINSELPTAASAVAGLTARFSDVVCITMPRLLFTAQSPIHLWQGDHADRIGHNVHGSFRELIHGAWNRQFRL